jgi:hypothetical protein
MNKVQKNGIVSESHSECLDGWEVSIGIIRFPAFWHIVVSSPRRSRLRAVDAHSCQTSISTSSALICGSMDQRWLHAALWCDVKVLVVERGTVPRICQGY